MFEEPIHTMSLTELRALRDERIHQYRLDRVDETIDWFRECKKLYVSHLELSSIESILTHIKSRPFVEWKNLVTPVAESFWMQFNMNDECEEDIQTSLEIMIIRVLDDDEHYRCVSKDLDYLLNYIALLERTQ